MQMVDLITKKKEGGALSEDEIHFMIEGFVNGTVPDYQMSAMLMAICFQGMTDEETYQLTMAMLKSGDTLDLSRVSGIKADKHSTGGVGDKTSLVLCPMVAALGVKMAKMSGRGLGHTGGTIDKLESIPGFRTDLSLEQFFENVDKIGFAIAGQTANLVPADKKIYALRDVTGTVASLPLIVGSIMSKKLAAGADVIVLDVKCGSGGFMHTDGDAFQLARGLVRVGALAGRRTVGVVSDMDQPLGFAVGNAMEVKEAIETLRGELSGDLLELCLSLGACILTESGFAADDATARAALEATIENGAALEKFAEFVRGQGGDDSVVRDTSLLPSAPIVCAVKALADGYVTKIQAEEVGVACRILGGGRATKESVIDPAVGILIRKKIGEHVAAGETFAEIHARDAETCAQAEEILRTAYAFADAPRDRPPFIRGVVRADT